MSNLIYNNPEDLFPDVIQPSKEEAETHLMLLDEEAEEFTFQTFHDCKTAKVKTFAKVLNGSLDEHWDELVRLNQHGAGIYVTINKTDLKGRKEHNIKGIRAVFQEDDGDGKELPIEPHLVVESSPNKFHRYFFSTSLHEGAYRAIQRGMIDLYGSDPSIGEDTARVLRLAGFYHCKNPDKPFMTRIVSQSNALPMTEGDLLAELKINQQNPLPLKVVTSLDNLADTKPMVHELIATIEKIPAQEFESYGKWLKVGMGIHHASSGEKYGLEIFDNWSKGTSSYDKKECHEKWKTFSKENRGENVTTFATLCHFAKIYCENNDLDHNVTNVTNVTTTPKCVTDVTTTPEMSLTSQGVTSGDRVSDTQITPLTELVNEFILHEDGKFTTNDVYTAINATNAKQKNTVRVCIKRMIKANKINRIEGLRGVYETAETGLEEMVLGEDDDNVVNLPFPLGISDMVNFMEGQSILIAGASNAGKTAFVFSICDELVTDFCDTRTLYPFYSPKGYSQKKEEKDEVKKDGTPRVRYLNSEMASGEIVQRVKAYKHDLSDWIKAVEFIDRRRAWSTAINPSGLNIIDFVESHEDFFLTGKEVSAIHNALDDGVAIICVQKKQGQTNPKGGEMVKEKPRLVINLDLNGEGGKYGMISKLTKVKNPIDYMKNPQGMECDFRIIDGVPTAMSEWRFVTKKQRVKINESYERMLSSDGFHTIKTAF